MALDRTGGLDRAHACYILLVAFVIPLAAPVITDLLRQREDKRTAVGRYGHADNALSLGKAHEVYNHETDGGHRE